MPASSCADPKGSALSRAAGAAPRRGSARRWWRCSAIRPAAASGSSRGPRRRRPGTPAGRVPRRRPAPPSDGRDRRSRASVPRAGPSRRSGSRDGARARPLLVLRSTTIGRRKALPIDPRSAFQPNGSAQPLAATTPAAAGRFRGPHDRADVARILHAARDQDEERVSRRRASVRRVGDGGRARRSGSTSERGSRPA